MDIVATLVYSGFVWKFMLGKLSYSFINGQLTQLQEFAFKADVFYFTDEGYLMIEGLWYSPEQFVLTLSEEEEHIAFRVYPLEDKYREMCSKYIAPVSYGLNNLFLTEWNTKDYSNLDFYDIFEKFYQETYKVDFPYIKNEDWSVGNEYFVPSREFENVIMQHFQVTQNELRKLLRYDSGKDSYIFRPRGNEEFDYVHIPYPEVVSYKKNDDGSLTLCVYAVFPNDNTSKKFVHEVTIQDDNGKIFYLSNHIIERQKSSFWWHADRYTDEAWKEYYHKEQDTEEGVENGDISWMFPKIESQLFSEEEKSQIDDSVLSAAKKVWKHYKHVKISEHTTYNSDIIGFTKEKRIAVVTALGENNVIATSENVNMVHGEKLEAFYKNYKDHKEDMLTIYDIYEDGLIATITFLYRKDEIQAYYVAVKPDKNGNPYLTGRIVHEIEFINLTEKGYFFYANKFHLSHSIIKIPFMVVHIRHFLKWLIIRRIRMERLPFMQMEYGRILILIMRLQIKL